MPLIDSRLKPGQWRIEKLGASGRRYRLQFQGTQFQALSRMEEWDKGPSWNRPLYWRRLYTAYKNNRHPHGKLTVGGFEDLGIVGKTKIAEFIAGQHVQVQRAPEFNPYDLTGEVTIIADAEGTKLEGHKVK